MPQYEFRCPICGSVFLSPVGGDRMEACRNEGCDGVPKRVWGGAFIRSNIRAVPREG